MSFERRNFIATEENGEKKATFLRKSNIKPQLDPETQTVNLKDFNYYFELQAQIEQGLDENNKAHREPVMDYHEYARRLWQKYIDTTTAFPSSEEYQQFEANLIYGLRGIEMDSMVYADIQKGIDSLVSSLESKIKKAVLWSTGDVDSTGYQVEKIASSQIIIDTLRSVRRVLGRDKRDHFFREKTEYIIDEDKFAKLRSYLQEKKDKGEKNIKLVLVEDSIKNIEKVKMIAKEIFGPEAEVTPIWANYSREGQNLKSKNEAEFEQISRTYNGIDSFSELGAERFEKLLEGSELIIDFDGVITDNIKMRNVQAQVIDAALKEAQRTRNLIG